MLPGVTVEAASPALIEKGSHRRDRRVRSVPDHRTEAGSVHADVHASRFQHRRSAKASNWPGRLRPPSTSNCESEQIQETVTVTGAAPVVDVQSTTVQTVLTKQVLDAIPAGRSHLTQAILVPGLTASQGAARGNLMDVGGTRNLQNTLMSIHGGRDGDTRVQIDGVRIGNMSGAGQWHNFVPDQGRHAGTRDRLRRGVGRGDLRRPPHQLRAEGRREHVSGHRSSPRR